MTLDPNLDLVLERVVDVPRELVWAAWTKPEHVVKWLTPAPWSTVECKIDLRPGGLFYFVMQSPEGQKFPHTCCFLEVVPNERLTWTNVLGSGFRPIKLDFVSFTAVLQLQAQGKKTKYTATAMHLDADSRKKHADMGFAEGWGKALDQLVALAGKM